MVLTPGRDEIAVAEIFLRSTDSRMKSILYGFSIP
jgi:hypothetical protein